ncbi:MAG: exosortase/archaeosortase family protein [Vicinamibacteria bacterium]|nr:exosortase/archaeosortase family protein [Vicinamibacteria bacterium]
MTFVAVAGAWSLGLFALLRAPAVERWVTIPLTELQKQVADTWSGTPAVAVAVTADCSGTDVIALCLAAIAAAPVTLRARIVGMAGALALVLGLNTIRIASLGHAAASPWLFDTLHLQVWPLILVLAAAGYVFAWMWLARAADRNALPADRFGGPVARSFAAWAVLLLVAFALSGPRIARSDLLIAAGGWTASAAAVVLGMLGQVAVVSGNVLSTSRGGFQVTPDCLATALVPLLVAGVLALPAGWLWRGLALAVAPLLFFALAVARLLLLALPPVLAESPLVLVHGFHQWVLGGLCVVGLALMHEPAVRGRWVRGARRAAVALAAAALVAAGAGPALARGVEAAAHALARVVPHTLTALTAPGDVQGALALLPAFQAGLLVAFGVTTRVRWRRLGWAFGGLVGSQLALLVLLGTLTDAGVLPHAALVRGWAVIVPVLLCLTWLRHPDRAAPGGCGTAVVDGHR